MLPKIFQHGIFVRFVTDLIFSGISAQNFAQKELRNSKVLTSLNYIYFQGFQLFLPHLMRYSRVIYFLLFFFIMVFQKLQIHFFLSPKHLIQSKLN